MLNMLGIKSSFDTENRRESRTFFLTIFKLFFQERTICNENFIKFL